MVHNKIASEGEIVDLKFTCRFPASQTGAVINYMAFSIVDSQTLDTVIDIPSFCPAIRCVEVYIEKVRRVAALSLPST